LEIGDMFFGIPSLHPTTMIAIPMRRLSAAQHPEPAPASAGAQSKKYGSISRRALTTTGDSRPKAMAIWLTGSQAMPAGHHPTLQPGAKHVRSGPLLEFERHAGDALKVVLGCIPAKPLRDTQQ
jgi:hypothetical protein